MELRLLGTVEVLSGGRGFGPARPQERLLLAVLAMEPGRFVTTEAVLDRLWDDPPAGARRTLHVLVAKVRAVLRSAAVDNAAPMWIETRSGGYVLHADLGDVDVHHFRQLVEQSNRPESPDARRRLLRDALSLWRGEPLAGLHGQWAQRTRESWSHRHLDAVVSWADAETDLGNPVAAIDTLTELTATYPYIETLPAALMRALNAAGRRAEALDIFTRVRRNLVDTLGTEPSAELQATHRAVLADTGAHGHEPAAPDELPADTHAFVGRESAITALDVWQSSGGPDRIQIAVVSGTAGVGKTALAVHWAHRMRTEFPDGILHQDLRGYDPDQPIDPVTALGRMLISLGFPASELPLDQDGRAARYRTALADRRLLIVLDNAADVGQVRPLLPGAGRNLVLITSRDRLAGLVAVHGAVRIELDVLAPDEAVGLLGRLIGVRAAAEPEALAALAGQCARLPLALRVAAELASGESDTPLGDLAAGLLDQRRRLARFSDDDSHADVAAVFSWSLRRLPAEVTEVFRMLGLHPGADFGSDAVAALNGIDIERAEDALDRLRRAHLVTPAGPQRYGMHDLLRAYASQLAAKDDHRIGEAALRRLFDHYVATAARAIAVLHPAEAHRRPKVPADPVGRSVEFDADQARSWLDRERANLVAVAATGKLRQWPAYPIALSAMLFRYLDGGHVDHAEAIHGHALDAARTAGDPAGQGHGCLGLGVVRLQMSDYPAARTLFLEAEHQFAKAGDIRGCARALGNLAGAEEQLGRYAEAADHVHAALQLYVQSGDALGQTRAECHLGIIERQLGRYDVAARHLRGALTAARTIGDRNAEASAIDNLADVEVDLGQYQQAADHYRTALAMRLEAGERSTEVWTRTSLGVVLTVMGRAQEALRQHELALETLRDIGQQDAEAWVLNGLGEAAHALAEHQVAITHHTDALAIATATRAAFQQARAHAGLGRAHRALGDLPAAHTHLGLALTIHRNLGTPEADRAETELANLDAMP